MRIGLFSDTYHPSVNGIVYVIDSLKQNLENEGHEVYIFCPARSLNTTPTDIEEDEEHTIRFPSVKGAFYDNYDMSLFFPPLVLNAIKELDLDIIHYFTPGQVGMMGMYAAHKTGTPVIAQHCTDLRQYIEHYHSGFLLSGLLMLASLVPFVVKVNGTDIKELVKVYRPRREGMTWNIDIATKILTIIYSKCDAVIALSRKSKAQLESWQTDEYRYNVTLMPNGVDQIPSATNAQISAFKTKWNIDEKDEVFGFVGRLGAEKNLDILIQTLEKVATQRSNARLLFVGDFDYRETLEEMAATSQFPNRITFTGALKREDLGVAYGALDVFVFPSLTDTQGWVLHEAAFAGLPVVLVDKEVSEVVSDGSSGFYAENSADDIAKKIVDLFEHPKKRQQFGQESRRLASEFTEKVQVAELIKLYQTLKK